MKAILLFIFIFSAIIQAQTKDVTLVLPWKHQFQFAGFYVAKEMGYYKDVGLNVIIKEDDLKRDSAKDIAALKYEFAIKHSSVIVDKINHYPNIILLAAMQQSSALVLVSKKRDDIKTLGDLKNKTIMMHHNDIQAASVNAMLFSGDLKKDDYSIIDTKFDLIDLINGTVDLKTIYTSNEPFTLQEKGIQYTIFDPKDYGYDFYSDILFTSTQMIKNNPQLVKDFVLATYKGWEYAYKNIDETADIILNKYNTQSKTKKALLFEAKTLKKLAFEDGRHFGEINSEKLNKIINYYRFLGFVNKDIKINTDDFIYHGIINEIKTLEEDTKRKNLILSIYVEYKKEIFSFLFILIFGLFTALYFRHKTKSLLAEKEKELEKNYQMFDKYICSSKTDLNGNIISVSDACITLTGYKKEELVGKTFAMLRDKSTPDSVYKDLWLTISTAHSWSGELNNVKKDGSIYRVKIIISPIFDKKGNIIGFEDIKIEK